MQLEQLVSLGYSVDLATSGYEERGRVVPPIYRVEGYGSTLYVRADDTATLAHLLDPELHAERVSIFENGLPAPVSGPSVQERVATALGELPNGPISKADLAGVIAALVAEG